MEPEQADARREAYPLLLVFSPFAALYLTALAGVLPLLNKALCPMLLPEDLSTAPGSLSV
jgi:hypothetical protein